jgi:predicted transcriptional regulator of viral defense system
VPSSRAKALYEIAIKQSGCFTTQQANAAGFEDSTHPYHVKHGNWFRIHRGLYRLTVIPESRLGILVGWHLWSRDRKQVAQAIFSHLTALEVHRLLGSEDERIFMTVPHSFRRTSKTPLGLILYKGDLAANEIVDVEGIRITSPKRTLEDIVKSRVLSRNQLSAVLDQASRIGLVDTPFVAGLLGDQFQLRFEK